MRRRDDEPMTGMELLEELVACSMRAIAGPTFADVRVERGVAFAAAAHREFATIAAVTAGEHEHVVELLLELAPWERIEYGEGDDAAFVFVHGARCDGECTRGESRCGGLRLRLPVEHVRRTG